MGELSGKEGAFNSDGALAGCVEMSVWERLGFKLKHYGVRSLDDYEGTLSLNHSFADARWERSYFERRSYRSFDLQPVRFQEISGLLEKLYLMQVEEIQSTKGCYGSAGSLYPVQTYIYIKPERVEGVLAGLYYYHPYEHSLKLINAGVQIDSALYPAGNDTIFEAGAFVIYFIGKLDAISPLYGVNSRDFALIETGMMAQLLETSAPEYDIGLCQIGGFDFQPIRPYFKLEKSAVYLQQTVGGRITGEHKKRSAYIMESGSYALLAQQLKVRSLMDKLKGENIDLYVINGKLRYKAHKGAMTAEIRMEINQNKESLIHYLQELD